MIDKDIKLVSKRAIWESLAIAFGLTTFMGIRMALGADEKCGLQYGLISFAFTFLVAFSITIQDHFLVLLFQKKYPGQKNNIKRIVIEFITTSIGAAFIISVIYLGLVAIIGNVSNQSTQVQVVDHIGIAIAINLIMMGIAETEFMIKQWKKSIIDQEKLKRQNAETRYQALNKQVNPHFLFNSLNTLASLIPQSQEKSLEFINKFSIIYRYILDSGNKLVVEVRDEIDFIQSFISLQKARFEEKLLTELNIDSLDTHKFIPPLSLQLLVENALKHNELSEKRRLHLKIFSKDGYLVVQNTYQPRKQTTKPSGIGLENLKNRYEYLTEKKVSFGVENDQFVAKIPLLEDVD